MSDKKVVHTEEFNDAWEFCDKLSAALEAIHKSGSDVGFPTLESDTGYYTGFRIVERELSDKSVVFDVELTEETVTDD
jgi:hypothetical protein